MDAAELLAALEADPALRSAARRIILTDELLALPDLVRENSRQIAELRRAVAAQQETMAALQQAVAELKDIASEHSRQILGLSDRVGTLRGDLAGMRLESSYRNHAYGYFGSLVRRAHTLGSGEVADLLEEAVERGGMSAEEAADVSLADLLVAGTEGGDRTYLVVEVSCTLGSSDVERAARRAALLAGAGHRARGVAAGQEMSGAIAAQADQAGVAIVLDGRLVA